jgi:hypothetical protein
VRDQRGRLLSATLGFLSIEPRQPELQFLHRCFDNWRGIGDVVAGMARQGYDLELRRYDGRGWRALFFPEGFEHSLTAHAGAGWARSPWEAVQRAAVDPRANVRARIHRRTIGLRRTTHSDDETYPFPLVRIVAVRDYAAFFRVALPRLRAGMGRLIDCDVAAERGGLRRRR